MGRPRPRRTKTIATIGPACDEQPVIEQMIRAGMNVARLNLSHGSYDEHHRLAARLRRAAECVGAHIAVLVDTKGIEIRTGSVEGGAVRLENGQAFELHREPRAGDASGVSVSHDGLSRVLRSGDPVLLDDGRIELRVESADEHVIRCRVLEGGLLGQGKGVNLPETELPSPAADTLAGDDLAFAVESGADYVAVSFVQNAADVAAVREALARLGADIPIIAKIENRTGVANLERIVEAADGVMVARGDLGVELPFAEVPAVQKHVIRTTVSNGKPVITATQMLDSMERNPRPTRAEVSDVANAILDGTSAVMLSGETAVGKHPVEAVKTMAMLALRTEASLHEYGQLQQILPHPSNVVTEAVSQAAITMAHHLNAAAIITLTETGFTSRQISKYRPGCPIIAVTASLPVVRRLAMNWGVNALHYPEQGSDDDKVAFAIQRARERGWVQPHDIVVSTAGRGQQAGSTNLIRVMTLAD